MRKHVRSARIVFGRELCAPVRRFVQAGVARIARELEVTAPHLGACLHAWMCELSPTGHAADFFEQPRMFPTLLLPWWLARTIGTKHDNAFDRDLVYSSMNGYYFIRLVDNVMDGHAHGEGKLLPATAFFHTEFVQTYEQYFAREHSFWDLFRKAWIRTNEAAVRGGFTTEFGIEEFKAIAAAKLAAAQIPIAATAYHFGRPDLIPCWLDFCDQLAQWFQMMDDVFDWRCDLRSGQTSYFLSEAQRRRNRGEVVEAWVVREGFDWGMEYLQVGLRQLRAASRALGSDDLEVFLVRRGERLDCDRKTLGKGLSALRHAATVLELCS